MNTQADVLDTEELIASLRFAALYGHLDGRSSRDSLTAVTALSALLLAHQLEALEKAVHSLWKL